MDRRTREKGQNGEIIACLDGWEHLGGAVLRRASGSLRPEAISIITSPPPLPRFALFVVLQNHFTKPKTKHTRVLADISRIRIQGLGSFGSQVDEKSSHSGLLPLRPKPHIHSSILHHLPLWTHFVWLNLASRGFTCTLISTVEC